MKKKFNDKSKKKQMLLEEILRGKNSFEIEIWEKWFLY